MVPANCLQSFHLICLMECVLSCGCTGEVRVDQNAEDAMRNSGGPIMSDPEAELTASTAEQRVPEYGIVRWESVPELTGSLALFETVFWESDDTASLRHQIASDPRVKMATVLEIGTGSGLLALCCLQAGAHHVVATDLNPAAIANARWNARQMKMSSRLDVRLVPRRNPAAWSAIGPDEKFDIIISNPPWENNRPGSVAEFALYDPDFQLMNSLVTGARNHLKPGGRIWLAYGSVSAIRFLEKLAHHSGLSFRIMDPRDISTLPELFLPGMMIELTIPQHQ